MLLKFVEDIVSGHELSLKWLGLGVCHVKVSHRSHISLTPPKPSPRENSPTGARKAEARPEVHLRELPPRGALELLPGRNRDLVAAAHAQILAMQSSGVPPPVAG